MVDEIITSYLTNSVNNLAQKVQKQEESTVKIFSYLCNTITDNNKITDYKISYILGPFQQILKEDEAKAIKLESTVNELKSEITELTQKLSDANSHISLLENKIESLKVIGNDYVVLKKHSKLRDFLYKIFHYGEIKRAIKEQKAAEEREKIEKENRKRIEDERLRQKQIDDRRRKEEQAKKRKQVMEDKMRNILKTI